MSDHFFFSYKIGDSVKVKAVITEKKDAKGNWGAKVDHSGLNISVNQVYLPADVKVGDEVLLSARIVEIDPKVAGFYKVELTNQRFWLPTLKLNPHVDQNEKGAFIALLKAKDKLAGDWLGALILAMPSYFDLAHFYYRSIQPSALAQVVFQDTDTTRLLALLKELMALLDDSEEMAFSAMIDPANQEVLVAAAGAAAGNSMDHAGNVARARYMVNVLSQLITDGSDHRAKVAYGMFLFTTIEPSVLRNEMRDIITRHYPLDLMEAILLGS